MGSRSPKGKGQIWGLCAALKHAGSLIIAPYRMPGRILRIYTSCDVFPRKEVPNWGCVGTAPQFISTYTHGRSFSIPNFLFPHLIPVVTARNTSRKYKHYLIIPLSFAQTPHTRKSGIFTSRQRTNKFIVIKDHPTQPPG